MKLIEKKCPNCGANLEFSEKDKSCKCEYCHRAFEIERDENNENEYNLNVVETSKTSFIIFSILTLLIFGGFIVFMFTDFNQFSHSNKDKVSYYTKASELTSDDFEDMNFDSEIVIKKRAEGPSTTDHSYTQEGDQVRQKVYVASKKDGNVIVSIYEVKYYDFFHPESRYTVYVPIKYENVDKNKFVDKFSNPQVTAPKYYFDAENTYSISAYTSMDELYADVIKPLEKDYKITEK